MDALAALADGAEAQAKLGPLVTEYRAWISRSKRAARAVPQRRKETAEELAEPSPGRRRPHRAGHRPARTTRSVWRRSASPTRRWPTAARQRLGVMQGKPPESITPEWRPFQLAFLLMNLPGIADPTHADREVVDLLFFPTGGGKTEAYLGLAAFTLVLRRLRNPGIASAGPQRADALHAAAADARPARPRGDA